MSISSVNVSSLCFGLIFLLPYQPPDAVAESKVIDRIDGYGGYKFGMTLSQADAVRTDDVVQKPCSYPEMEACINRETELFGEKASVSVLISSETHTVKRVHIIFATLSSDGPGSCNRVLSSISLPLVQVFGVNFKKDDRSVIWHFPLGGRVIVAHTCFPSGEGIVVVSYEQSDGFN